VVLAIFNDRPPAIQLDIMGESRKNDHKRNQALLAIAVCIGLVPIFPLAFIALWNAFKPRRVSSHLINCMEALGPPQSSLAPASSSSSMMLPLPPAVEACAEMGGVTEKGVEHLQPLGAIVEVESGTATIRYAMNAGLLANESFAG
jgi:hypothetical protein